jgi:mannosyl-3-phosphoglycerate phosphatase
MAGSHPQPVIFTDLDGTLLHHRTYSFAAAEEALDSVAARGVPLVMCSSKTRAEIEYWREKLDNHDPFVTENGGGIFVPHSYFSPEDVIQTGLPVDHLGEYNRITLGRPYRELRAALQELRTRGFAVVGFGDMDAPAVAKITGLPVDQATLAKQREFDETFLFDGPAEDLEALFEQIRRQGLNSTQGTFHHLLGDNDKGKAVGILTQLFRKALGSIVTMALGDSPNDIPMLREVDHPVLVKNHRDEHDPRVSVPNLTRIDGAGPVGWHRAVLDFLQTYTPVSR